VRKVDGTAVRAENGCNFVPELLLMQRRMRRPRIGCIFLSSSAGHRTGDCNPRRGSAAQTGSTTTPLPLQI
jgi:hypothetical protein